MARSTLDRLLEGNQRFASGYSRRPDISSVHRRELTGLVEVLHRDQIGRGTR